MRVTVVAPNVYTEFGISAPIGSTITVGDDYGASLVWSLKAIDTDGVLSEPGNRPFDQVPPQSPVSGAGNLLRTPDIPSSRTGIVSDAYTGGATPWTRLYGPNEFRGAGWSASSEWSAAVSYVTAASPANGPAMFRREGASMLIDFSKCTQTYGNFRTMSAGLPAATFRDTPIAVLIYIHRMQPAMSMRLRIGADSSNYIYYTFQSAANMLVEGWNVCLCHTSEAIGVGGTPNGQLSFQGANSDGWYIGAGSFDPNSNAATINYVAVEFLTYGSGIGNSRSYAWVEGIYVGGKDKPRLTIGFDIQGPGLDLAKQTMEKYGLLGYAAVPTGNGNPGNPAYLWTATDVARMQSLYAAGWDIIQHSVSHNSMGTLSDDGALAAEFESCREQLIAIGCPAGADLMATPNGSWSNRVIALAARAGVRWMRHVNNAPMLVSRGLIGLANPLIQGATTFANQTDTVRSLAYIDLLIQYGASGHAYTHGVIVGASDPINTNVAVFDAICAGIAARVALGQIEVVTPSAFVRDSAPPVIDSILANPSRLSLVANTSPFDLINTSYKPLRFVISGGTVSAIAYSRDGSTFDSTGQTAGQFDVAPGDRLRITYTAAPTIIQYAI